MNVSQKKMDKICDFLILLTFWKVYHCIGNRQITKLLENIKNDFKKKKQTQDQIIKVQLDDKILNFLLKQLQVREEFLFLLKYFKEK